MKGNKETGVNDAGVVVEEGQKKKGKKGKKVLRVLLIILLVIAILAAVIAIVNLVVIHSERNLIGSIAPVEYEAQLTPQLAEDGYYTFVTDEELKVMQLTDVHIGAGFLSTRQDAMAINAAAAMITEEKPDLVVVSGDIAYPVPYQAGTFNNKNPAKLFAELMEQLDVYWCLALGNHDTESYAYFSRETIGKLYESDAYPHCLFQRGPADVDGEGNYVINVRNTKGEITQSLIMIDSHSYTDNDYLGLLWKYDCIHADQIDWYEDALLSLQAENGGIMPKSLAFFHIPLMESRDAYREYAANGYSDTENVQYIYGKAGEHDTVVYCSEYNEGFFDKALALGSTQGMFYGHDHLNNFSVEYKGVRLTYGYSIDYLAYSGIMNYGAQRGCTIINVTPDGAFDCHRENYYQDKYRAVSGKETVTMDDYYDDAG